MTIPHSKPRLDHRESIAVQAVIDSGFIGTGAVCREFANALADTFSLGHVALSNSGSSALYLALQALEIQANDEVIMPSYVCSAVLNEVLRVGAKPVVADVLAQNMNLSAELCKDLITTNTKSIILPHLFGNPANVHEFLDFNIPIIEDCAMSIGASIGEDFTGSIGTLSIFSFYATKIISSGHGGAVATKDSKLAQRLDDLLNYDGQDCYHMRNNLNMSDINAAVGMTQLNKLDYFVTRRREIADKYHQALANWEWPNYYESINGGIFARYGIKAPDLEAITKHLQDAGIDSKRPVYKPIHLYLDLDKKLFPVSQSLHEQFVSLPIYPALSDQDQDRIIEAVLNYFAQT